MTVFPVRMHSGLDRSCVFPKLDPMKSHFFDYNATTPLCPEAKAAWNAAVDDLWLNPSSPYRAAARVHAHLEQAREKLAAIFGIDPKRIAFNSGATEGNNAVFAYLSATLPEDAFIGVSPTEHPSVIESAKCYFGDRIVWLELDESGAVAIEAIDFNGLAALSVMAANNETGVLNPWQEIAAAGKLYHCDASQWIGKMPLEGIGACSYVVGCAHKFGGPPGMGFWILPEAAGEFACFAGGEQESGHRAGTQNVAGILAMVAALEVAVPASDAGRDALVEALPEFELAGARTNRLWNTAMMIAPKFSSMRWIRHLEKKGFLVSGGSACSAGKEGASHVLSAMGFTAEEMRRSLRISSGWLTTVRDWLDLAAAVKEVHLELKSEEANSASSVLSI